MKENNRIAWGIFLLVFGFIFLLKQLSVFSPEIEAAVFNFRNLPLVFGLIFLIVHENKSIGIVSLAIGVLLYLKDIIIWTKSLSDFIWPILLIGAGAVLLFPTKKKKEVNAESHEIAPTTDKKLNNNQKS
ncbi:MAG: hypothetical protein GX361_01175 [Bacteroidales bacterium]|mgnify:CR=1 FL=1|nr:hypothetical protein [Bacteroidales bacterium]